MRNLAAVFLDGYITSNPELRQTPAGKSVTTFSLAVHHNLKEPSNSQDDVSFIEIEVWGKQAENCVEFLRKGSKVTIQGDIRQDRWKSPEGINRQKIKVIASTVRFDPSHNKSSEKEVQAA
ncbi:MAG: single-stranded DNA-binding protein [Spirochaetota bacterium]